MNLRKVLTITPKGVGYVQSYALKGCAHDGRTFSSGEVVRVGCDECPCQDGEC